jgi:hypothetical protein
VRAPWRRALLLALLAVWLGVAWWQARKPLPAGVRLASPECPLPPAQVRFIADITGADAWGRPAVSQGISEALLQVVREAHSFVLLDYPGLGAPRGAPPPAVAQLTAALVARRRQQPQLRILFITDPAAEDYGAHRAPQLQALRAAGVEVVSTNLAALPDSNPLYSSVWRLALNWWDTPGSPFGIATRRLNFKANQRRLIIADDGRGSLTAVLGSASPASAESTWSNVALQVNGGALEALLESELAIARFSGWRGAPLPVPLLAAPAGCPEEAALPPQDVARLQLLTEGAVRGALLGRLNAAGSGDEIEIAAGRLAERSVIEALLAAARRGAQVRLLLDPAEDGSSGGAAGIPNQPVASELVTRSDGAIHVRWYRTHGERFNCALVMITSGPLLWLSAGSAQLTRRGLDDYDLTSAAALNVPASSALAQQAGDYFDTLWGNRAALGIEYSADFTAYADPAQSHYWLYRLMEASGFAPF